MPTTRGTISQPLTTQQTLEKVSGLISELGDDTPETPEPEAPATPVAAESESPEQADPQPSAPTDDTPNDEDERVVTVKVDGVPTEFTIGELKRNASSQAHNTQRAQALTEKEKLLEPAIRQRVESEYATKVAEYDQGLQQIIAALEKINGEPDWVQRRKELPPEEFLKQKADWEASKAELDQVKRHQQEVADQAAQAQAKAFQTWRQSEQDKLLAAVPEWSDKEKLGTEHKKMLAAALAYGFAEEHVRGIVDHRLLLLLRDATRWRELKREPNPQARPKTSGIKTAHPGTPDRPRPNAAYEKKVERAAKTGRQRDAMDAIADLIPD